MKNTYESKDLAERITEVVCKNEMVGPLVCRKPENICHKSFDNPPLQCKKGKSNGWLAKL